jgi:hypothetical protein
MLNLKTYKNFNLPFSYTLFENALNIKYQEFVNELNTIDESYFIERSNENFQKKELSNCNNLLINKLLKEIVSEQTLSQIKLIYEFENLTTDPTFDGGGLTITDTGGFLRYHADFPYSNSAKKYRVLNAILYLSDPSIIGGDLHLLDFNTGTVEATIKPIFGTLLVFPTSKYTIHGFSKILKGKRITINSYLYDDKPIDDRNEPSKTIWFNKFN